MLVADAGEGLVDVPGALPGAPIATGLLVAAGKLGVWGAGAGDTTGSGGRLRLDPGQPTQARQASRTAPTGATNGTAKTSGKA